MNRQTLFAALRATTSLSEGLRKLVNEANRPEMDPISRAHLLRDLHTQAEEVCEHIVSVRGGQR